MGHNTSLLQLRSRPIAPAAAVPPVVCGVPSSVPMVDHSPLGVAAAAVEALLQGPPTPAAPWPDVPGPSAAAVVDCCSAALLRQAMALPRHCAQALRIPTDCFWLPMVFTMAESMDCQQRHSTQSASIVLHIYAECYVYVPEGMRPPLEETVLSPRAGACVPYRHL